MGFSARRAVKGNESGIRVRGNVAVARVPLPYPCPVRTGFAQGLLGPSTDVVLPLYQHLCHKREHPKQAVILATQQRINKRRWRRRPDDGNHARGFRATICPRRASYLCVTYDLAYISLTAPRLGQSVSRLLRPKAALAVVILAFMNSQAFRTSTVTDHGRSPAARGR